ncbi:MAG: hypothetical protein LUE65_01065 [Clostridiales bacterium]|nr:hypothetical protein [Clostridiales bacterium]
MSNEDVCFKTGLSAKSFEWILENGYASIDAVERIADVLKVDANQIITDDFGENENVIEFLKDSDRATLTFCQGRFITRVRKLAESYPECQIVVENKSGSVVAHIPTSWIKVNPPKRYTAEQRAKMGERLNRNA